MAWPPQPNIVWEQTNTPGSVTSSYIDRQVSVVGTTTQWTDFRRYGNGSMSYAARRRVGQKFKNYLSLIEAGEILVSDYVCEFFEVGTIPLSGTKVSTAGNLRFTDSWSNIQFPNGRYTSLLNVMRAIPLQDPGVSKTNAYAAINEAEFELGVFIAESRESFKLLIEKYDKLVRIVQKGLPKRKAQSQKDWTQQLADAWLRMRFGVEPLLKDMAALLDIRIPPYKKRKRYFGFDAETQPGFFLATDSPVDDGRFSLESRFQYEIQNGMKNTVWVDYESDDPLHRAMQAYGLTNPVGVLWEATRLSFVVDWLIDIGSFIQAYSITGGGNVLAESQVSKIVVSGIIDGALRAPNESGGFITLHSGTLGSFNYTAIRRGAIPVSMPDLPSFNVRMNITNIVDSLALIRQMVPSLKP